MSEVDIKESDWYKERPKIIQKAINLLSPAKLYKIKSSGKQCHLISYYEPHSEKFCDVTLTVQKTGIGGAMAKMGLSTLDTNQVFGVKITDLEEWID